MNSRLLASSSSVIKRRLVASSSIVVVRNTLGATRSEDKIICQDIDSSRTVRSLHSGSVCFSSIDALDMTDTFARRHSKWCLLECDDTELHCHHHMHSKSSKELVHSINFRIA